MHGPPSAPSASVERRASQTPSSRHRPQPVGDAHPRRDGEQERGRTSADDRPRRPTAGTPCLPDTRTPGTGAHLPANHRPPERSPTPRARTRPARWPAIRRRSAPPTRRGPKPSAFSVAYSDMRSRAVIAMVLAITARMMKITTNDTMRMAMTMASVMATKPIWNAFSVSVSVSASEFRNCASMAARPRPRGRRWRCPTTNTPTGLARAGHSLAYRVSLR